jgi:hypothetical protein
VQTERGAETGGIVRTGGTVMSSPMAMGCTRRAGSHSVRWASWARQSRVASRRFQMEWAGSITLFFYFLRFSNYSYAFQLVKYEKGSSKAPKNSKLCMLQDEFERNKFPFGRSPNVQQNMN